MKAAGRGPGLLYWQLLKWIGGSLLLLSLHRLGFILAYYPHAQLPEGSIQAVIAQFALGFRYDISTAAILVFPLILFLPLYLFGQALSPRALRYISLLKGLQLLYIGLLNLILFASSYNFGYNNKHLSWEFYAYLSSLPEFLLGIWELEPFLLPVILFAIIGFGAAAYHLFFKQALLGRRPPAPPDPSDSHNPHDSPDSPEHSSRASAKVFSSKAFSRRLLKRLFGNMLRPRSLLFISHQIILIAGLVVALRGGLQQVPIGVGDVLRHQSAFLNNIPLNGLFTISRQKMDRLGEFEQFFDQKSNSRFIQELLDQPSAFVSSKYPLLRYMPSRPIPRSADSISNNASLNNASLAGPNLVLVILESFTAKFLAQHSGDARIAPNFQQLISKGRYFERFFACGSRSSKGLFAIFSGLPDRAGVSILRSPQLHNRMGGLPYLLRRKGYLTHFLYGGNLDFDHLDDALLAFGFERTIGESDLDDLGLYKRGNHAWGYDDEELFDLALRQMDQSQQPFFMTIYTLNTHHPYSVPDRSYHLFDKETPNSRFLNSFHYTDHALGEFMREVAARPYFSNTIFFFVADHSDHSIHSNLNRVEGNHLPFLIYAPGRIAPGRSAKIGSQLDLLPTILALAGGESLYASMGNDLNDPQKGQGFAFAAESASGAPILNWVEGGFIYNTRYFGHSKLRREGSSPSALLSQEDSAGMLGQLIDLQEPEKILTDDSSLSQYSAIARDYRNKMLHFHQFARYLEKQNNIWPRETELQEIELQQLSRER